MKATEWRTLPPSSDPCWLVTFTGSAPEQETSRAAQTTLADGVIGTAGSAPIRLPGSRNEVIVGNVYVGSGAETDMLRAPTWTLLDGEPAADPALVRVLDLRSGTLHQQIQTTRGPLEVASFSSLASPASWASARGARAQPSRLPGRSTRRPFPNIRPGLLSASRPSTGPKLSASRRGRVA
jgi:hypothetical protein